MSHGAAAITFAISVVLSLGAAAHDEAPMQMNALSFVQMKSHKIVSISGDFVASRTVSQKSPASVDSGDSYRSSNEPVVKDGHCVDDDEKAPHRVFKVGVSPSECKAQCEADSYCVAWEKNDYVCNIFGSQLATYNTPAGWSFSVGSTRADPTGGSCLWEPSCTTKCYLVSRSSDDSDTTGYSDGRLSDSDFPVPEDGNCVDDDGQFPNAYASGAGVSLSECQASCSADSNCVAFESAGKYHPNSPCVLYGSQMTKDSMPAGWYFIDHETASDPTRGNDHGQHQCFIMSRSSDDSDSTRISGDPHVWYDGIRTSIHLPTDRLTKLLEQDGLAIFARGGPNEETKMNYIFAVAVYVGGQELARLEQELGRLDGHRALMTLTAGGVTSHVSRNVTAVPGLRLRSKREQVEVLHEATGVSFMVSSRKTTRKDAANSHHLNVRFDKKSLALSGTEAATGALPEIWGTQPLSLDVSALILHRSEGRSNRSSAAGVNDGLVGSDGEVM